MNYGMYDNFVSAIRSKIPKKSELVNILAEMLTIERESVYRRLRGDVPFTFMEALTVSKNLGISLDSIGYGSQDEKPMFMELSAYQECNNIDYAWLRQLAERIRAIGEKPNSEHGEALSSISPFLWPPYKELTRFFTFREMFQYTTTGPYLKFEEIPVSDELLAIQKTFQEAMQTFSKTFYIMDSDIIQVLLRDIKYFESIHLIRRENVELIKAELAMLLDSLETMAARGKLEGSDNKFELYISDVDIDMTYAYFWSENLSLGTFITFIVRNATTLNQETCEKLRRWVRSLRKVSTLVSDAGEKKRIIFFEAQRAILDTL